MRIRVRLGGKIDETFHERTTQTLPSIFKDSQLRIGYYQFLRNFKDNTLPGFKPFLQLI